MKWTAACLTAFLAFTASSASGQIRVHSGDGTSPPSFTIDEQRPELLDRDLLTQRLVLPMESLRSSPVLRREINSKEAETLIRLAYVRTERVARLSGHGMSIEVSDVNTVPWQSFDRVTFNDIFRFTPTPLLDVMPIEWEHERAAGLDYEIRWQDNLSFPDPVFLGTWGEETYLEYLRLVALEDAPLARYFIPAVSSYRIELAFGGRIADYTGVFVWLALPDGGLAFAPQDPVLYRLLQSAMIETMPVFPSHWLRVPDSDVQKRRVSQGSRSTVCLNGPQTTHQLDQLSLSDQTHHETGQHAGMMKLGAHCDTDSSCRSTCTPFFAWWDCVEWGDKTGYLRQHRKFSKTKLSQDQQIEAPSNCGGAMSCAIENCFPGTCSSSGIGFEVSGKGASISVDAKGAPLFEASFTSAAACPRALEDAGATPPPGSDPQPVPTDPRCHGTCSPILIDLERDGFELTGLDDPVSFDLDPGDRPERLSWTVEGTDDAFLALDRNLDGRITSGAELFGSFTPQPLTDDPNGFLALAVYDDPEHGGNGDGGISEADSVFPLLTLWRDGNRDGVSQPEELATLAEEGIEWLDLRYRESRRRDRHGNLFRWASRAQGETRAPLSVVDVIFLGGS